MRFITKYIEKHRLVIEKSRLLFQFEWIDIA